jgi:omega-6 fatty acid desaturase (delta-12 desaturase)
MIQHDCGHGAYFRSRRLNDLLGRALGVVTLTPYDYWKSAHAVHHATAGNLDRRGIGDISTLTVSEYRALPKWKRTLYRLYRNPLVLFGIGPIYLFVLKHRLPLDLPFTKWGQWLGVLATNLAIAALTVGAAVLVGPVELLQVQLPLTLLAAAAGVWLFFVQHQFEDTYWRHGEDWSYAEAAVYGSSYYRLPRVLQWFTASIGLHHIHHLWSRIPNYRLQECLDELPELQDARKLSLRESLRCVKLSLWDEAENRMIGFRELRRRRKAEAAQ